MTNASLKRAFVVGGAGYVGSAIARQLLQKGYTVAVFDDFSTGLRSNLPAPNAQLELYEGTITEASEIRAAIYAFNPDVIFHMAALHYIPDCTNAPDTTLDVNTHGTLNVINAARELNSQPRFIFTSSASVYGAKTPAPQRVDAIPQPCDIYGYSKLVGEHLVRSRYNNYVIARLFNVFGDRDPIPHLIPSIVRQLLNKRVELGNPDSKRDFIHVSDAARAFIALAEQGVTAHTYNIGSGVTHSVQEVIDTLVALSSSTAEFIFQSSELRAVDPGALCADISDITRDTNWQPRVNLEDGLKTVLEASKTASQPETSLRICDYIAVISDFDDTILHNKHGKHGLHERSRQKALEEVGHKKGINFFEKITPEMLEVAIKNAPTHISEGAFWWLLTEAEFIDKRERYNPTHPLILELTAAKSRHYQELLTTDSQPIKNAKPFFKSIHQTHFGNNMAIASSAHKDDIHTFLKHHAMDDIFAPHRIIACENTVNLKPHPETYETALAALGVPSSSAKQVLVFEDDPKGISAAKSAGLTVCAITTRFCADELTKLPVQPDYIIEDFAQIPVAQ